METFTHLATSALIVAATIDLSAAKASFLKELPNGNLFDKELGHPGGDTSAFSNFALAFQKEKFKWSPGFCKAPFPGTKFTNGGVLGDPCCTFTEGGTPDFTVEAFTDKPTTTTKCAASGGDELAKKGEAETTTYGADEMAAKSGDELAAKGVADTTTYGDDETALKDGGEETGTMAETGTTTEGGDELATKGSGEETITTTEGGDALATKGSGEETITTTEGEDEIATKGEAETTTEGGEDLTVMGPVAEPPPEVTGDLTISAPPSSGGGCVAKPYRKLRQ